MATPHGKKSGFAIENASTSLTNLGAFVASVDFPRTVDTAEVTGFNSTNNTKKYVPGNADATVSIEGPWDRATVDATLSGILSAEKELRVWPGGTTVATGTNFVQYKANAVMTGYNVTAGVDNAVRYTADFQLTGTITRTTTTA